MSGKSMKMEAMTEIPTVRFKDLCPDRCNFKDKAFEQHVTEFMGQNMPGFPIGLLDTTSPEAYDRWQVEPEKRWVVVEVTIPSVSCAECGEEYTPEAAKAKGICCPLEVLASSADADEDYEPMIEESADWLLLSDSHYDGTYAESGSSYTVLYEGVEVAAWDPRTPEAAVFAAQEADGESAHESQHGFPWANSWVFLPDDRVTNEDLEDAGFTVATYIGGKADYSEDETYRLCGIDGGGYSFKGQHFGPLVAAVAARYGWAVPTDNGLAYIKTKEEA